MKKQKIQILILLVLCIVCVGGYFIIRNHTFETEEETVSVDVTNFNKDDVTELILSGDHEVHLVKTDDIWTENSLPDETIKESTVNTLLNEIANITTTETVVEAPEDLSQYGLEEPFRTITAVLSDGTQVVIYAGNKSDLLSEYYIKVEGDDNVYLVSSNIVTDFDKDPEDFIDETVVLLSHKKADSYIHIDVEFGEGEGKIPVDSIAKRAEAYKPKEKVTYKMIKEYIEAKYGFKVHTAYIAEVKRNLGLPMYDAPNAVEELKQPRKHPTAEKVEAIKDALKHFEVI